jgi:hypothetical protein
MTHYERRDIITMCAGPGTSHPVHTNDGEFNKYLEINFKVQFRPLACCFCPAL